MKFLTFLKKGEPWPGILSIRPGVGEQAIIDIRGAVELLRADRKRLWWITGWQGPWGEWTAPGDMTGIDRHAARGRDSAGGQTGSRFPGLGRVADLRL